MMKDVDALNRGPYQRVLVNYLATTTTLRERDILRNPVAYQHKTLQDMLDSNKTNLKHLCDFNISDTD